MELEWADKTQWCGWYWRLGFLARLRDFIISFVAELHDILAT